MPDNIIKMLRDNYKKVAMGNFNKKMREARYGAINEDIPMPKLNFEYDKFYAFLYICTDSTYQRKSVPILLEVNSDYGLNPSDWVSGGTISLSIPGPDATHLQFNCDSEQERYILLGEWIAIE